MLTLFSCSYYSVFLVKISLYVFQLHSYCAIQFFFYLLNFEDCLNIQESIIFLPLNRLWMKVLSSANSMSADFASCLVSHPIIILFVPVLPWVYPIFVSRSFVALFSFKFSIHFELTFMENWGNKIRPRFHFPSFLLPLCLLLTFPLCFPYLHPSPFLLCLSLQISKWCEIRFFFRISMFHGSLSLFLAIQHCLDSYGYVKQN